jgi:hypothetical protein
MNRLELVGAEACDTCTPDRNQARSPVWNEDKISHPVQMVREISPDGRVVTTNCRRCLTKKLSMLKRSKKK